MEKISTLIVDDERPARRALRTLLELEPDVTVIGEAADGEAALEMIRRDRPQLVFLDIQMPRLTGLEVVPALRPEERPEIVFVTAYDEHALRAFELQAIDYVVKPFDDQRFHAALERARRRIRVGTLGATEQTLRDLLDKLQRVGGSPGAARPAGSGTAEYSRLVVKADGQLHFINQTDVRWVEGQGDFLKLHLNDRSLLVRMTLTKIEGMLDPAVFVRIHKSTIVNLNRVRRVMPMLARSQGMELDDGTALPIGSSYREVLTRLR